MRGKLAADCSIALAGRSIPACAGETRRGRAAPALRQVYPRVCGGNGGGVMRITKLQGLSPRVRGKLNGNAICLVYQGSIPACAGETRCSCRYATRNGVYPRVCGGNAAPARRRAGLGGLSPRVRGKLRPAHYTRYPARSIPACAGETQAGADVDYPAAVYPRVCGGTPPQPVFRYHRQGLSPRVRGKRLPNDPGGERQRSIPACAGETRPCRPFLFLRWVYPRVCGGNYQTPAGGGVAGGLSPRVRGKRTSGNRGLWRGGSIPACAGETPSLPSAPGVPGVYPRVCGGNIVPTGVPQSWHGLSPRVRGKRGGLARRMIERGSIPACAGETVAYPYSGLTGTVYPRVCGGNASSSGVVGLRWGLSPRVRGKLSRILEIAAKRGSIPACAGETRPALLAGRRIWVYPRVCGGNRGKADGWGRPGGLSPRVRGKRMPPCQASQAAGSIPACAGETKNMRGFAPGRRVYPRVCGGNSGRASTAAR